ncbi:MAG: spore germination protein [Oscillospiraceae bacterium]|nr:spore germination protein [Oscillospiraceae bacterium]
MKEIAELNNKLSTDLVSNTVNVRSILENTSDLIIKYANVAGCNICVIACEGMVNTQTIAGLIYNPMRLFESGLENSLKPDELMQKMQSELLVAVEQNHISTYKELIRFFMSGFAVILADGIDYGVAIAVQGWNTRSVERPLIHTNMRGSCEGFTENLRTNISLVRRRIKSPTFVVKTLTLGQRSQTDVSLCYLSDKAEPQMLKQVEERLEKIPVEMILESGYIEPFLQDKGNSVFTQVGSTDRPDNFAAKLYDGRIGIIVDGTPYAMYLPLLFSEHFQTMDDYSGLTVFTTFTRWLKYIAFILTVLLPGFFVAVSNFNPELFPPTILFNIISAEQKTPFTILSECIIVILIYEIMREAGLRLPSVVGHAVSIIGGLVLGDIVVNVGLISAPIVLIVALSAITSFIVPDLYPSIAILRFAFILAGGFFGLFGITALGIVVLFKVCAMSAYGVPYMAPLTPFTLKAMRDYFIRQDWRKLADYDVGINELTGVELIES